MSSHAHTPETRPSLASALHSGRLPLAAARAPEDDTAIKGVITLKVQVL